MKYKISIITVCYNSGELLPTTINSIKNQTYKNIEYIVIDGNSTDNTTNIIENNLNTIYSFISEPDNGIYDAMNKALVLATGDFVIFMGAGDEFFKKDIIEIVNKKITNPNYLYYGDVFIKETNTIYWGKFNSYKLAIGNICHQAIFYPKCIYKNINYNLKYKIFADYAYNISLFKSIPFIYLNEIISFYDYNGISSTANDLEFEKDVDLLIKKKLGTTQLIYRKIYHTLKKYKNALWK